MRIKNTIRNMAYAMGSYLSIAILALVLRKMFLDRMTSDYLGYEGLFSNIFAVLSVADLGMSAIISYRLYEAIAKNDKALINKLMVIYKYIYRLVGIFVGVIGLLLIPFLRFIIKGNHLSWNYVYFIYILQLLITLCGFFLAYKRVVFVVYQRESECVKVDWCCSIGSNILRVVVLLLTSNYASYLFVSLLTNIISNLVISHKVDNEFEFIDFKSSISKNEIKELGITKDIKNNIFLKICGSVYGGTDSILISAFLGISYVGLLNNYDLIGNNVNNLFTKLLNPFQATISNYVYSKDTNQAKMFHMFDRISFFLAAFISTSFIVLFNPFIELIFGEQYLLPFSYIAIYSVNMYVLYNHKFLSFYRSSFGKFELDKYFYLAAAILNIFLSIVLVKPFGMAGIMFGTLVGQIGLWVGRIKVVFTEYPQEKMTNYISRQIINFGLALLEATITICVSGYFPKGIVGFMCDAVICLLIPNAINFLVFFRTEDMKMIKAYARKSFLTINHKRESDNFN